jgi:sec-independent protein translocase protein TatB
VDFPEIVIIFGVALVVLGPKKLPGTAAQIGRWVGRARAMARQFREQLEQEVNSVESALDTNAREPTIQKPASPSQQTTPSTSAQAAPSATPTQDPSATPTHDADGHRNGAGEEDFASSLAATGTGWSPPDPPETPAAAHPGSKAPPSSAGPARPAAPEEEHASAGIDAALAERRNRH